ncbi:YebC/PmpR family DNA-binding transcriptional regulator [Candidatus Parcubacteria bacterium]|nr:MAG: YebC/PmpR family DNA-binding transcriptional regulator [Candidatus Parcubacteria bacterium]
MSGHSKWSQIKHKKGIADAKKGQVFSKLAKIISVAAREGGPNPETNPQLRLAIERARASNMPGENIERAIEKASGQSGERIEVVTIEAFGPGGVAILINATTDNKNRTLGELRNIINDFGGKPANEGSVRWLFKEICRLVVLTEKRSVEEVELKAIEFGAEDVQKESGNQKSLIVIGKSNELEMLRKNFIEAGCKVELAEIDLVPENPVSLQQKDREKILSLTEKLEEHPDVQGVYLNASLQI